MSESTYSQNWYRVSGLKPRVRLHGEIHRHEYRGQIWYVLEDHAAGRYNRFSPSAYQFIGLMDGERTVEEIWDLVTQNLGDDAPTQEEAIQLLGQLHGADVLQCDVSPDSLEIFRRYEQQSKRKWMQRISHPLAVRIPVFDPERMLTRTLPFVRPVFSWFGLVIWVSVVLTGAILAAGHWTDLTENIVDKVLTPENLLLMWLAYPVVKVFHELGHAYATKVWGGEVHEIGVMLLVLLPVPYVEASAASAFRDKYKRMVVGGIGIMVELLIASIALLVWLNVEPGYVRALAYNVMLIGGVSTLFFNGNPLLRFDGYYVLADALEIPNLATRAKRYLSYLVQRYGFAVADAKSPATAPGERFWFGLYGIASFVYRMFIMVVIVLFVSSKFFIIGILLGCWAVTSQMLLPMWKSLSFVFAAPQLRRRRARAVLTTTFTIGGILAVLCLVPVPLATRAEGMIWLPEQAQVRAATEGFVQKLVASPDTRVRVGDPLIVTADPNIEASVKILEARISELDARLAAVEFVDRSQADVLRRQRAAVTADLEQERSRREELVIRSPNDGLFLVRDAEDAPGRYLKRGDLVGYVANLPMNTVRVVVGQADIGLVRERTSSVEVVPGDWSARPVPAEIIREVPAGTNKLPATALGSGGGGDFLVDPRDPDGLLTFEKVFQFDLALDEADGGEYLGARVFVRFGHGTEPLAFQWYRSIRRLFLRQFKV